MRHSFASFVVILCALAAFGDPLTPGQSVLGAGTLGIPGMTVETSGGNDVVFIAEGTLPVAYGGGDLNVVNGCLGPAGGIADIGSGDFSTATRKHEYAFSFNAPIARFSIGVVDWGDFMPNGACPDGVCSMVMTAYDAGNHVVTTTVKSFDSTSAARQRLPVTGDACMAQDGDPGRFVFSVEGSNITRITLQSANNASRDPNMALWLAPLQVIPDENHPPATDPGQSVVGTGTLGIPGMTVETSGGNDVVFIAEGMLPVAYGGGELNVVNGCLGPAGGIADIGSGDFSIATRKHEYAFSFNSPITKFSIGVVDWGDFMPNGACPDGVCSMVMTAYDADNQVVTSSVKSFDSTSSARQRLPVTGDACTAQEDQPGRFVFSVAGSHIRRVTLHSANKPSLDPNMALWLSPLQVVFENQNHPPVADAGPDQIVECSGVNTAVTLDGSASSDPDAGDVLRYTWSGPFGTVDGVKTNVMMPFGDSDATLLVSDGTASDTDSVHVKVVDTKGPVVTASASPTMLWPANHKMVPVAVQATATDACSPSTRCRVLSVASNEPVNGLGDGDTSPDWEINGQSVLLRAERSGKGTGRVYSITVECTDASGNATTKVVTVTVPLQKP